MDAMGAEMDAMGVDGFRARRSPIKCILGVCSLVVLVLIPIIFGLSIMDQKAQLKKARKLPHPQYTLSGAALSPNANVDDQNRLTADFSFTLIAYNDPNIKNKTIFYGNSSAAQVTLYYLVGIYYAKNRHAEGQTMFASSSSAMVGPSKLSPLSSAVFTLGIHVQNLPLPYPNNGDEDGAPVYRMLLNVDYQARFDDEEESQYHRVSVECYDLVCTFPKGFETGHNGTCISLPPIS